MDIDLLSKMIKELILDHDRVDLPGLGTFVAETVPAAFTDKGYTITPPYRKLSFRPGQGGDGLLVALYASVNNVSEKVALAALTDFVAGMKEILEKKKNVVFPGLGRLRATKENNFFFVSDEDLDIYPEGFGLEPVSLKTHEETKAELSSAIGDLKNIISGQEEPAEEPLPEESMSDEQIKELEEMPLLVTSDTPDSESVQNRESEPGPDPAQESMSEPEPAPDPEPESVSESEMEPEQELKPESETELKPESEPESPSGQTCESVQESEPATAGKATAPDTVPGWKRKVLYPALAVLGTAILLLALYILVARLFPGVMDGLLYNNEDYEILHNISQFKN